LRRLNQPFAWHEDQRSEEEDQNATTPSPSSIQCRNSVQGRVLLADDRGRVCSRTAVSNSGCCSAESPRYACHECEAFSACCRLYEHCVSCCMRPDKKVVLTHVLNEAKSLKNILLLSASDQFDLCLAKCRTNSGSVRHENVYVNAASKHCYGGRAPPAEDAATSSQNGL